MSFEISKVSSVSLQCEKIMCGTVAVNLCKVESGLELSNLCIADGGDIYANNTTIVDGVTIVPILRHIQEALLPMDEDLDEDPEASFGWSLQLFDDEENEISSIDFGYWGDSLFLSLLHKVEETIGECAALKSLRGIVDF